jgi:hypothetical protein
LQKQPGPEAKGNNEKKIREALVIRPSGPEREYDGWQTDEQYSQHIDLSVGKQGPEGPEKSDQAQDLQHGANQHAPHVEGILKP